MDQLFRQESLEQVQSPDRFDELLRITSPRGWIALLTFCMLIAAGLVWSIFGRIATRVDGIGMLMDPRGVQPIVTSRMGRLTRISVRVGDKVSTGQVVATLVDPDTEKRLEAEKVTLTLLQGESAKSSELMQREVEAKRKVLQAQKQGVQKAIEIQQNKVQWLENRLGSYKDLFEKGLVLKKQVVEIELERDNSLLEIDKLKGDLIRLSSLEAQEEESINERKFKLKFDIEQSKAKVDILENELKQATEVTSPCDGMVVSQEATAGKIVEPGQSIVTILPDGRRLEVRILVSAFQGKDINPGMTLQITPSTVKREEYGFMPANVTEVGDFPVNPESVNRLINNPELVQAALKRGPMIQVKGELVADSSTVSGYQWSSLRGKSINVSAGTICTSQVPVKEIAPITLVIPTIKSWIGS